MIAKDIGTTKKMIPQVKIKSDDREMQLKPS